MIRQKGLFALDQFIVSAVLKRPQVEQGQTTIIDIVFTKQVLTDPMRIQFQSSMKLNPFYPIMSKIVRLFTMGFIDEFFQTLGPVSHHSFRIAPCRDSVKRKPVPTLHLDKGTELLSGL